MEDVGFKKDETPYLVFACKKCQEFSYVKTIQKTKKCLRCGRTHQVRDILSDGEEVIGMTEAVNAVKRKQNEIAIPEFRSGGDFVITASNTARPKSKKIKLGDEDKEIDYTDKFNEMVIELSSLYNQFPKYLLEIKAEDYGIPAIELKTLIRSAKKSGELIKIENDDTYYRRKKK